MLTPPMLPAEYRDLDASRHTTTRDELQLILSDRRQAGKTTGVAQSGRDLIGDLLSPGASRRSAEGSPSSLARKIVAAVIGSTSPVGAGRRSKSSRSGGE